MGPIGRTFVSAPRLVLHGLDAEQLLLRRDRDHQAIFLELDHRGDRSLVGSAAIRIALGDRASFADDARGLRRLAELAGRIADELELVDEAHDWNVPLEFPPSGTEAAAAAAAAEINEAAGRADLG